MATLYLKFEDFVRDPSSGKLTVAAKMVVIGAEVPANGVTVEFNDEATPSAIINAVRSKALQEVNVYLAQPIPQGQVVLQCPPQ